MEDLLLLVHRIPYPPNKGDKVRSFHLLLYLHKHFKVHLGCFIDDDSDWEYEHILDSFCASRLVRPLNKSSRKIASLRGLFLGQALSLPYYADGDMNRWVHNTINRHKIKRVVVFSSAMAQYVLNSRQPIYRLMDFVDVDSDKWRQYADSKSGIMKWIYKREARRLEQYEIRICKVFDKSYFVSEDEANLFRKICNDYDEKIDFYNNGVDYQFFNPELTLDNPFPSNNRPVIVFSGAMDYWANVDAVVWFVHDVLHRIQSKIPNVDFYIVGSNPSPEVIKLKEHTNVYITGRVDDVRPYINHATLVVAPMRIARGVQNKVLEAMAFNKPIVATSAALEGIESCADFTVKATNNEEEFATACISTIENKANNIRYRNCVVKNYDWQRNLDRLSSSLNVADNNAHTN